MDKVTFANLEVLDFYKTLPFNYKSSDEEEVKAVRNRKPEGLYPGISELLGPNVSVLEVGCGTGWLSNSLNYMYKSKITGIDFNPVAITRARGVAKLMGLDAKFLVEDLFLYEPDSLFDLVVSFGVLHHTNNCEFAVRRICEKFVRKGGHVMIGLYHKWGRQPFLDYFDAMKKKGATEEEMLAEFRSLQSHIKDEVQLVSWFRDQVLHPHETLHTLKDMLPILKESGMELISTSINHFAPIKSIDLLLEEEKKYESIAIAKLAEKNYFPGFFVFLARKK